ncbi:MULTISPECIES: hypothetical protein [unclassified Methylobacterium]|uniref:hypothetical protein n=1 Tax=unclassified Methylobacterium TaxID=2615210 RepID=UPI00226A5939|nr:MULTISPECIES: hypothetical protein [unclassified Methylobacterium]
MAEHTGTALATGASSGKIVSIPSIPETAFGQAIEAARFHLDPNPSRRMSAIRYGLG